MQGGFPRLQLNNEEHGFIIIIQGDQVLCVLKLTKEIVFL